jgi:hypothetical protein
MTSQKKNFTRGDVEVFQICLAPRGVDDPKNMAP